MIVQEYGIVGKTRVASASKRAAVPRHIALSLKSISGSIAFAPYNAFLRSSLFARTLCCCASCCAAAPAPPRGTRASRMLRWCAYHYATSAAALSPARKHITRDTLLGDALG